MKLEEGMYVRTNYREEKVIRKIINIVEDYLVHDHRLIFDKPTKYIYYIEDNNFIAKESLIDLIKIGDHVNDKRVYNISIVDGLKYLDVEVEDYLSDMPFINADQIESIVTKEQFESMKYEVKKDE